MLCNTLVTLVVDCSFTGVSFVTFVYIVLEQQRQLRQAIYGSVTMLYRVAIRVANATGVGTRLQQQCAYGGRSQLGLSGDCTQIVEFKDRRNNQMLHWIRR